EYLSLGQVPDLDSDGRPRTAADGEAEAEGANAASESPRSPDGGDEAPAVAGSLRAPFGWERLLVDASVIGGRDRWRSRLDGLETELRRRGEEAGRDHEARREHYRRQLER